MNRVFVTGGSGFIGTNLVESLGADQIDILNYDLRPPRIHINSQTYVNGDILDKQGLAHAMQDFQPDTIVHLAARVDIAGKTLEEYAPNTSGVENIISAIRNTPSVNRVVFASSRYVHQNESQPKRDDEYSPFTMYGASKAEGEKIVRAAKLEIPWVIVRPTSIWGPWFDIPYKGFFQAVRRGLYMHPAGERIHKSYGFAGNVVHQLRRLIEVPSEYMHGQTVYAADYQPIEVRSMAERIRSCFGAPPVRDIPLPLMKAVALTGDVFKKAGWYNPPLTSFRLKNLRCQMVYDISQTAQIVGPLPYSTEEGVMRTVEWMIQHS